MRISSLFLAGVMSCGLAVPAHAQDFRRIKKIPTAPIEDTATIKTAPGLTPTSAPALSGQTLSRPVRLSRAQVEAGLESIIANWNIGDMEAALHEDFAGRERSIIARDERVAPGAWARLLSTSRIQILDQSIEVGDGKDAPILVSRVAVRANIQVEYEDPGAANPFQVRRGQDNYVIQLRHQLKPKSGTSVQRRQVREGVQ